MPHTVLARLLNLLCSALVEQCLSNSCLLRTPALRPGAAVTLARPVVCAALCWVRTAPAGAAGRRSACEHREGPQLVACCEALLVAGQPGAQEPAARHATRVQGALPASLHIERISRRAEPADQDARVHVEPVDHLHNTLMQRLNLNRLNLFD